MPTTLVCLIGVWTLITIGLIALLTYRSFLSRHEDDQIFLSRAEDRVASEQQNIVAKVTRLGRPIKTLAFASGGLLVVTAIVWVWGGLSNL